MQQDLAEFNLAALAERNRALKHIEAEVTFTAEACQLISKQLQQQKPAVEQIESQLNIASDNVEIAAVSLCQAEKHVITLRWWKAGVIGIGVAIVVGVAAIVGVKTHQPQA